MKIAVPNDSLIILCGAAGCGKSSFARKHFKRTQSVSSDECRALLTDSPEALWASGRAFQLFHTIIDGRLSFGKLTVADSTALSATARRNLRRCARLNNRPATLVLFHVPADLCIERDRTRRRQVGEEVIRQQVERLEEAMNDIRRERYHAVYILDPDEVDHAHVRTIRKESRTEVGQALLDEV